MDESQPKSLTAYDQPDSQSDSTDRLLAINNLSIQLAAIKVQTLRSMGVTEEALPVFRDKRYKEDSEERLIKPMHGTEIRRRDEGINKYRWPSAMLHISRK